MTTQTTPQTPTLTVPPSASRETRIKLLLDYINEVKDLPLEPAEFVNTWVRHPLDAQGYRRACSEVIGNVLGISCWCISGWGKNYGKRPAYMPMLLRLADIVKRIQEFGICRPQNSQSWEQSMTIPCGWPRPLFVWNDRVLLNSGGFGTVRGMYYAKPHWEFVILMHEESPVQAGEQVVVREEELSRW